jgi:hypothetical protein
MTFRKGRILTSEGGSSRSHCVEFALEEALDLS